MSSETIMMMSNPPREGITHACSPEKSMEELGKALAHLLEACKAGKNYGDRVKEITDTMIRISQTMEVEYKQKP